MDGAASRPVIAPAQALVPLSAGAFGMPLPTDEAAEIMALTGLFAALWLAAAWLSRNPARDRALSADPAEMTRHSA